MFPPRPDQMAEQPVPYAPGPRTGVPVQANALLASGLALDTSVQATNAALATANGQLASGVAPTVSNYQTGQQILQGPGTTTILTMSGNGRIWAASVSFAMGSSGGTGANQGYARVFTSTGLTLAIVECCVAGNPDADSGTCSLAFNGVPLASGATIKLDVNNGGTITGVVLRGSGLAGVSVP